VIAFMLLIFSFSTDALSERRTSRYLIPFLRWLKPDIAERTLHQIHFAVRKAGHLAEYAILGCLLWRALRKPVRNDPRPWSWTTAGWAVLISALYAATDELHQSFVATRWGSGWDILIDAVGAGLGLGLLWAAGRLRKAW
jgi:VanZ family protein